MVKTYFREKTKDIHIVTPLLQNHAKTCDICTDQIEPGCDLITSGHNLNQCKPNIIPYDQLNSTGKTFLRPLKGRY